MKVEYADRIKKLQPYLFDEIDRARQKAIEEGRPVINLGVGDPDTPTPDFIVKRLQEAVLDESTHKYALNKGLKALRRQMADWYKSRFNVDLDPESEVLPLLGSKEGIGHVPMAFVNPGDTVLIPDPGYPPYNSGTVFAGGKPHSMPLQIENRFLPDLDAIDEKTARNTKLMHINYPNNPTGAVCDKAFYGKVVDFARKYDIIVCSDAAYTEMSYDGYSPPSFLEVNGSRDVGIEFHSLSKTFNMTGWRVGLAVGNAELLQGLAKVKANLDSGIFTAVQIAAIEALDHAEEVKERMNQIYTERRDVLVDGLNEAGWQVPKPLATFYVWAPVFGGHDSVSLAKALLEEADIVATPGSGFGPSGEGYIRMALTVDAYQLREVVSRIKKRFF
ncbi:MAG: aminotransferase class I/II-fold pyridoxal phosphate-dependent enzyme [Candidatus Omnitrophica bacterium]|nr:aminotransferase class I/II-fold pyridoxal phosphate-dependent enzyme [Candidatus Omnitrophota bacterium]